MNTDTAKRIAEERHAYMVGFLTEYAHETYAPAEETPGAEQVCAERREEGDRT